MKVTAFDFYDKDRLNPIQIDLKKVKKNASFSESDVTYLVTKVFKRKSIKGKCVELKMIAYKIPNTATTFVHKCPAKKGKMEKMKQEMKDELSKRYGKTTVDAWDKGRVKLKGHLSQVCPECEAIFWKEKDVLPESVEVVSVKGKKKLIKRT